MARIRIARPFAILASVCFLVCAAGLAGQSTGPGTTATPADQVLVKKRLAQLFEELGYARRDAGEPADAIAPFLEAIGLTREMPANSAETARYRIALAECYIALRDFAKAEEQLHLALQISLDAHDEMDEAQAYSRMGWASAEQYKTQDAIQDFKGAIVLFRQLGDWEDEALAENNLGFLYLYAGQDLDAATLLRDAAQVFAETQDKRGQAAASGNLRAAYDHLGEKSEGDKLDLTSLDPGLLCSRKYPLLFGSVHCAPVGEEEMERARQRVEKARADLEEAIDEEVKAPGTGEPAAPFPTIGGSPGQVYFENPSRSGEGGSRGDSADPRSEAHEEAARQAQRANAAAKEKERERALELAKRLKGEAEEVQARKRALERAEREAAASLREEADDRKAPPPPPYTIDVLNGNKREETRLAGSSSPADTAPPPDSMETMRRAGYSPPGEQAQTPPGVGGAMVCDPDLGGGAMASDPDVRREMASDPVVRGAMASDSDRGGPMVCASTASGPDLGGGAIASDPVVRREMANDPVVRGGIASDPDLGGPMVCASVDWVPNGSALRYGTLPQYRGA